MTSHKDVTSVVRENLHLVFGEKDPGKRLAELSRLWVPSSKSLFIDPLGLFRGHEAINNLISSLHTQYPGMAFTELGKHIHIPWQDLNIFLSMAPVFFGQLFSSLNNAVEKAQFRSCIRVKTRTSVLQGYRGDMVILEKTQRLPEKMLQQ